MIFTIGYEKLTRKKLRSIFDMLSDGEHDCTLIDVRMAPSNRFSSPKSENSFDGRALAAEYGKNYVSRRDLGGQNIECSEESVAPLREYDTHNTHHCLLICREENPGACHRHHAITAPHFPDAIHFFRDGAVWEADLEALIEDGVYLEPMPADNILTAMHG